eukprot:289801-Heterocapsa_arctica.AAC.1
MAEEAKEVRMEELHLEPHYMVSPRTKTGRNCKISAVRENDPDHPLKQTDFKFFKRCDIRDTASYFRRM